MAAYDGFGAGGMHLSPPMAWTAVRSKAAVMLLLIRCLLCVLLVVGVLFFFLILLCNTLCPF